MCICVYNICVCVQFVSLPSNVSSTKAKIFCECVALLPTPSAEMAHIGYSVIKYLFNK